MGRRGADEMGVGEHGDDAVEHLVGGERGAAGGERRVAAERVLQLGSLEPVQVVRVAVDAADGVQRAPLAGAEAAAREHAHLSNFWLRLKHWAQTGGEKQYEEDMY